MPRTPQCLCPYLDRCDARCAARHTLTRLREAFQLCAGNHECCTVYQQIRWTETDTTSRSTAEKG